MLNKTTFHKINHYSGLILYLFLSLMCLFFLIFVWINAIPHKIEEAQIDQDRVTAQLVSIENALKHHGAASQMQALFPEGACFTYTLYGLAWANMAEFQANQKAIDEIAYALEGQDSKLSQSPFSDTAVRNGVFWLGQRNYLLGKYLSLSLVPSTELTEEFHQNSAELFQAFIQSPTTHIDSYPGFCWPADNITALASLVLHDRLFCTKYREAYERWKKWHDQNPDPKTGMPSGQVDQKSGQLLEPARGCANSWIISILSEIDADFAAKLYQKYKTHFRIKRLGYWMFREYPEGYAGEADVDSGPIIWGAGVSATGIGLAAARGQGDIETEVSIRDLSNIIGLPYSFEVDGQNARRYLFGLLTVGDAFLTYGYSIKRPHDLMKPATTSHRLYGLIFISILIILVSLQAVIIAKVSMKRIKKKV